MKTLQLMGGNGWGGAAVLSVELCTRLAERGWEVHYLSDHPVANERFAAVPGARIVDSIPLPREVRPATDIHAFVEVVRLCRRERYDVVETYNSTPGVVGRLAARAAGVPAVFQHQAGWNTALARGPMRAVYWLAEWAAVRASTFSVCCGEAERDAGLKIGMPANKLAVIRNGIDLSRTAGPEIEARAQLMRVQLLAGGEGPVFGYAGRLSDVKDNVTLVRAFARYREAGGAGVLALAGDGPERQMLEALAEESGLGETCRFLGHLDDVPAFLGAIDVFVTTTLREGLSMSILESMGASRPAIVTDLPNNRELVVPGETGEVVPVGDAKAIAEAMGRLANSPETRIRYGRSARLRAEAHFSLASFVDRHVRLYEASLLRPRPDRLGDLVRLGIMDG